MDSLKRVLVITLAVGLVAAVLGCATMKPDFYPQVGTPNTITYTDSTGKEAAVFDLTGKWETKYHGRTEIVKIAQKGNKFEGYKTIGSSFVSAGNLTVSGKVIGNVVECNTHWSDGRITPYEGKLSKNVDEFGCLAEEFRKFKRIK